MITDGGRRGMKSKNETEQQRHYKYSIRDDAYRQDNSATTLNSGRADII